MNETLLWMLVFIVVYIISVLVTGLIARFINKRSDIEFPGQLCWIPFFNVILTIILTVMFLHSVIGTHIVAPLTRYFSYKD